jgi:hypothetical protein
MAGDIATDLRHSSTGRVHDRKVVGRDKTNVIARRPQADEAISDCPGVEIAAPAIGWLAMTCAAFATNLSYAPPDRVCCTAGAEPGALRDRVLRAY